MRSLRSLFSNKNQSATFTLLDLFNAFEKTMYQKSYTDKDKILIQQAVETYGGLENMDVGCKGRRLVDVCLGLIERTFYTSDRVKTQPLIITLFESKEFKFVAEFEYRSNFINYFTSLDKEKIKELLIKNKSSIKIIAENTNFFISMFKYFANKDREIQELLLKKVIEANENKFLPSIKTSCFLFDEIKIFINFNEHTKEQIINELLTDQEQYNLFVTSIDMLNNWLKTYPDYRAQLLRKAKQCGLLKLCSDLFDYIRLIELFPEEKEKIKQHLLSSSDITHLESPKDIAILKNYFDFQTGQILKKIAKLPGGFPNFIKSNEAFKEFFQSDSDLVKDIIAEQYKQDQSIFSMLVNDGDRLIIILKFFPDYILQLKKCLQDNIADHKKINMKNYIGSIFNLAIIMDYSPDLKDQLLESYFNSQNEIKYPSDDVSSILKAFSEARRQAQLIWLYIKAHPGLYAQIITSDNDLFRITKASARETDICGQDIASQQKVAGNTQLFSPVVSSVNRRTHRKKFSTSYFIFNSAQAEKSWFETRDPKKFVPEAFNDLFDIQNGELVLSQSSHSSFNIREILKSGTIYSRKKSGVKGLSDFEDNMRGDDTFVFTSPFKVYHSDSIIFSIPALCAIRGRHNNGSNVICKFYDWTLKTDTSFQITSKIAIKNSFSSTLCGRSLVLPKYATFEFYRIAGDEKLIATAEVPLEKMVYYGYEGLNNYLRYFIFLILRALPENHSDIKAEIYEEFKNMEIPQLHKHLTELAQQLFNSAELNFFDNVSLHHTMVKTITIDNHTTDLSRLREKIKKGDMIGLRDDLSDERTYQLLCGSYFLVFGFVEYAQQCEEPKIAELLSRTFHDLLEIGRLEERRSPLTQIPKEIIDHVYSLSSKPYDLDKEDKEIFNDLVAYRPNHGFVHAVVKAFLIPFIIHLINVYGKIAYKDVINKYDINQFICVTLYLVLGRESEVSFDDNPELYLSFRQSSSNLFYEFFKTRNEFSTDFLKTFAEAIKIVGNPKNSEPLQMILNICHKCVLGRVFTESKMSNEKAVIKSLFEDAVADKVATALLCYATGLLDSVGDWIHTSYDEMILCRSKRQKHIFVPLSQRENFSQLIDTLEKVRRPLLPLLDDDPSLTDIQSLKSLCTI